MDASEIPKMKRYIKQERDTKHLVDVSQSQKYSFKLRLHINYEIITMKELLRLFDENLWDRSTRYGRQLSLIHLMPKC